MVGCWRCTFPSIHLFISSSRSVVRGAVICGVLRGCLCVWCVVWCVWCVWCVVWCWCVLCGVCVVWCVGVVVWGGVYVCVFWCIFSFFSQFTSFFFLLSLSFFSSFLPLSSFPLFSLPLLLLSSLIATAANFEAFECDLAHGKCTAVGSLPPPLFSPPPFSPSSLSTKKSEGTFLFQVYFWR